MTDASLPIELTTPAVVRATPDAGAVYHELAPAVLGYLRAGGSPDPEDLLGEVFFQVARDIGRFKGDEAGVRRWVFSIAHHRMIDEFRRRRRRPTVLRAELPDGPAAPPAEPLDPALVEALGLLSRDQRHVIMLRFVADLSIIDVSRVLCRPPGVVKALQHRGLRRLAVLLGPGEPS